jgi:hypothetical protein
VTILGKEYEIIEADATIMNDKVGICEFTKQKIYIATGLADDLYADTLLHEILHVIDFTIGLELTEKQVIGIAGGLYAVWKDNQNIIEGINKEPNRKKVK